MILRESVPSPTSRRMVIGTWLLAVLAIPGWIAAGSNTRSPQPQNTTIARDAGGADRRSPDSEGDAYSADRLAPRPTANGYVRHRKADDRDRPEAPSADDVDFGGRVREQLRSDRPSSDVRPAAASNPAPATRDNDDREADRSERAAGPNRPSPDTVGRRATDEPSADVLHHVNRSTNLARSAQSSADKLVREEDSIPTVERSRESSSSDIRRETNGRVVSPKIKEMRALIDHLQIQVKALEGEERTP